MASGEDWRIGGARDRLYTGHSICSTLTSTRYFGSWTMEGETNNLE